MNIIKIDTKILVKEQRELDTLLIKSNIQEKEYLINLEYNPIAKRKEYTTLITILKRLSEDIDNLKDNISTKVEDDKIQVIYKPKNDRLFYWMKILENYTEQKYPSGITESHRTYSLQTKDKDKVHNIFEYNKALIFETLEDTTSPTPIESEYNDLIPIQVNDRRANSNSFEYFFYKKYLHAVDVYIDVENKEIEIIFPILDIELYFIEIYFLNRLVYLYDEPSRPINTIKTKFKFEDINDIIRNPFIKLRFKGYYLSKQLIDLNMNFLLNLKNAKLIFKEDILLGTEVRRNYHNKLIIRNIIPLSFGERIDNITITVDNRKSYFNKTLKRNALIGHDEDYIDSVLVETENKRNYSSYVIIKSLQSI